MLSCRSVSRRARRLPPVLALARLMVPLLVPLLVLGAPRMVLAHAPLVFGVVPQQSASRLARDWTPFVDALSAELDRPVRFATATDIPTFEACLAAGAYEIAYMNPYHYTVFSARSGYRALAHQARTRLRGILVTRVQSGIESLADLDGRTVAFPSPAAFGASVLPRAEAARQGVAIAPLYVRSHDSVYRAVARGYAVAGGGVLRTWTTIPDEIRRDLRVFYRTESYTPHAFAVAPRVGAALADRLQAALVAIGGEATGVLAPLGMSGIVAAEDADWDDVRALRLGVDETDIVIEGRARCLSD